MKKLIFELCLFALSTGSIIAQYAYSELNVKTEYITDVQNSRDALFINAQTWANANTTKRITSIETSDKGTGTLILKTSSQLPSTKGINYYSKINVQMNVKIDCRDNKYRISYSNFTSTVQSDETIDFQYLGISSLREMQKELETPIRLATDDFGKEVYWGYDQIIAVKQKYLEQNQKFKNEITTFEASCKKKKKEINLNNKRIAKNEMYINYLDYILRGFEHTITDLQKSIDKAMNICDGF